VEFRVALQEISDRNGHVILDSILSRTPQMRCEGF
jgi:hypothetical protein